MIELGSYPLSERSKAPPTRFNVGVEPEGIDEIVNQWLGELSNRSAIKKSKKAFGKLLKTEAAFDNAEIQLASINREIAQLYNNRPTDLEEFQVFEEKILLLFFKQSEAEHHLEIASDEFHKKTNGHHIDKVWHYITSEGRTFYRKKHRYAEEIRHQCGESIKNGPEEQQTLQKSISYLRQSLEFHSMWAEFFDNLDITYNPQATQQERISVQVERAQLKERLDEAVTGLIASSASLELEEKAGWCTIQDRANQYHNGAQSGWKAGESLHYVEILQFSKAQKNLPDLLPEAAATVRLSIARGQYEVASVINASVRLLVQSLPTPQKTPSSTLTVELIKGSFLAITDPTVSDLWIRRLVVSYPKELQQTSNRMSTALMSLRVTNALLGPIFHYLRSEDPQKELSSYGWAERTISLTTQVLEVGTRICTIPASSTPIPFSIASIACSVASLALSCELFITPNGYQFSIDGRTALLTAQKISEDLGVIEAVTPIAAFCERSLAKIVLNESLSTFSKRLITKAPEVLISLAGRVALVSQPELFGGAATQQLLVEFLKTLAGRCTAISLPIIPDWAISVGWITLVAVYRIWHDGRKIRASFLMQKVESLVALELHKEAQESLLEAREWNFGDTATIEIYTRCTLFIKMVPALRADEAGKTEVIHAMKDFDNMLHIAQEVPYYAWLRIDLLYYKVIAYLKVEDYGEAANVLQKDGNIPQVCAGALLYLVGQAQKFADESKHDAAETLLKEMAEAFEAPYKTIVAQYREYISCCKTKIDEKSLKAVEVLLSLIHPIPTLLAMKNFLLPICEGLRYTTLCNLFSEKPNDPEVPSLFGKLDRRTREAFVFHLIELAEKLCIEESYGQAHKELKSACSHLQIFSYNDHFIDELLPRYLGYLASKAKYPVLTEVSPPEEIQDRLFRIDRVSRFAKNRPSSAALSRLYLQLQCEKIRLSIDTGKAKESALFWSQEDLAPQISVRIAIELINEIYQLQQQSDTEALIYLEKRALCLKGFRYLGFFDRYQAYLRSDPSAIERIAAIDALAGATKSIDGVDLSGFYQGLQHNKFFICLTHKRYQIAKEVLDQPGIDANIRLDWVRYFAQYLLNEVAKRQEERKAIKATSTVFRLIPELIQSIDRLSEELCANQTQQQDPQEQEKIRVQLLSMKQQKEQLYYAIAEMEETNGYIPEARKTYLICRQLRIELGGDRKKMDEIQRILAKPYFGTGYIEESNRVMTVEKGSEKKWDSSVQVEVAQSVFKTKREETASLTISAGEGASHLSLMRTLTPEERRVRRQKILQEIVQDGCEIKEILRNFN